MLKEMKLDRVDLNLLVLFQIVREEGHVGRAAARLSLSPSAVSHGLRRLRALLGDPLFLRTPKGVIPTAKALDLTDPVADLLERARVVLSLSQPFDARRSSRRFRIAAPDGVSVVFAQRLAKEAEARARAVDVSWRQLLPAAADAATDRPWASAYQELESRAVDLAVVPDEAIPLRFHARELFREDFVIAMRAGHPFARRPTLEHFCQLRHVVVSLHGDPQGFVDQHLARRGLARRVALTVPNFLFALPLVADGDLLAALPRQFAMAQAKRFRLVLREPPLPLPMFRLSAVIPEAARNDAGIAWLLETLSTVAESLHSAPRRYTAARKLRSIDV